MNRYYPILQATVLLARVGDAMDTGTVGESAAPTAGDISWINAGETINAELNVDVQTKDRTKIVSGKRIKVPKVIQEDYTVKFTVEELSKRVLDLITGSNTTATDVVTAFGSQGRKYWIAFTGTDVDATDRLKLAGLCTITPAGAVPLAGEEFFRCDFDAKFENPPTGEVVDAYV